MRTRAPALLLLPALLAGAALVVEGGAATAEPACRNTPDREVESSYVEVDLSSHVSGALRAGNNCIDARGAAQKLGESQLLLPFGGAHPRQVTPLSGQIAFTGDGPDVVWRRLQLNRVDEVVTGVSGRGRRLRLLRLVRPAASSHGNGGRTLALTAAGARQLNLAAQGAPFVSGDLVGDLSTISEGAG